MGEKTVPVPINLRTHERSQLREFVSLLIDGYSEHATDKNNFDERVEELEDIHTDVQGLESGDERLFLESDKWTTLLSSLTRLHNGTFNRAAWLQKKLHRRLEDRLEELN